MTFIELSNKRKYFSSTPEIFLKIDYMLACEFKRNTIISSIFYSNEIKLEIDRMKSRKSPLEINVPLLNNLWVKEITRKIRKYFKMKKEYTYQNSWDATKLVLRGNFIAVNQYIKDDLKFKTNKKKPPLHYSKISGNSTTGII